MGKIIVLRTLFKGMWCKELGISVKKKSYKKYYEHKNNKKCFQQAEKDIGNIKKRQ